jgi:hypothetical protein
VYADATGFVAQVYYEETQDVKKGNGEDRHAGFRIVAAYSYTDETGRELFQVCRMENGEIGKDGKREETFVQRRPDNNGGYINGVEGVRQVPYRLRELLEAVAAGQPVFSVEGEKCVDACLRRRDSRSASTAKVLNPDRRPIR